MHTALLGAVGDQGGGGLTLSGGTDFTYGGNAYHKFTASGTLTVEGTGYVEYVVVGGGGSGGYNNNVTNGSGGGGGGAGIAWGTNYLLDSAHRSTFTIEIGAGATSNTSSPSANGSSSHIADWGQATTSSNFDWTGGTSYTDTGDKVGGNGGGGGATGQYNVCDAANTGASFHGSSQDWGSSGSSGGGGGWIGYCAGGGGQSGAAKAAGVSPAAGIYTFYSLNSDATQATHYIVGGQGGVSAGSTQGEQGVSTLSGTLLSSPTFNGSITGSGGHLNSGNRGISYAGIMLGTAGTGGSGSWQDANDGGGQAQAYGGPINAANNQGGGGAGGAGSNGGNGGSGIIIFRVL